MNPNCGCDNPGSDSNEYLMIKATPKNASTCGVVNENPDSGFSNCALQEDTFDSFLSDFLIPVAASSTSVSVCNPNVYAVGQWIHTYTPAAALQIMSITSNILGLVNRCPSGDEVSANPAPGTIIAKGTKFVTGPQPSCYSDQERANQITEAIALLTQLCMPDLVFASATSLQSPVGLVESDSADSAAGRCLKKIFGFQMDKGTPVFTNLELGDPVDVTYRRLVKHKTSNRVIQAKNYSEDAAIGAKQVLLAITSGGEILKQSYLTVPFPETLLEQNSTSITPTAWPSITSSGFEKDFVVNIAPISTLALGQDHYFVLVKLEIAAGTGADTWNAITGLLNGIQATKSLSRQDDDTVVAVNTSTTWVKVLKSDNILKLRVNATGNMRFYYRIGLNGVMY
jgi:hypothetical protein